MDGRIWASSLSVENERPLGGQTHLAAKLGRGLLEHRHVDAEQREAGEDDHEQCLNIRRCWGLRHIEISKGGAGSPPNQ